MKNDYLSDEDYEMLKKKALEQELSDFERKTFNAETKARREMGEDPFEDIDDDISYEKKPKIKHADDDKILKLILLIVACIIVVIITIFVCYTIYTNYAMNKVNGIMNEYTDKYLKDYNKPLSESYKTIGNMNQRVETEEYLQYIGECVTGNQAVSLISQWSQYPLKIKIEGITIDYTKGSGNSGTIEDIKNKVDGNNKYEINGVSNADGTYSKITFTKTY